MKDYQELEVEFLDLCDLWTARDSFSQEFAEWIDSIRNAGKLEGLKQSLKVVEGEISFQYETNGSIVSALSIKAGINAAIAELIPSAK